MADEIRTVKTVMRNKRRKINTFERRVKKIGTYAGKAYVVLYDPPIFE